MAIGRIPRIIGSIALILGGLGIVVVSIVQSFVAMNADTLSDFSVTTAIISLLTVPAQILFVVAYVLFAIARGSAGVFIGGLGRVAFIVLLAVYVVSELWFRFYSYLVGSSGYEAIRSINQVINILVLASILFAAVAVAARGSFGGFPRFVMFLPAIVLIVLQFSSGLDLSVFFALQIAYGLAWVVVAISYLVARSRVVLTPISVTQASENLTE